MLLSKINLFQTHIRIFNREKTMYNNFRTTLQCLIKFTKGWAILKKSVVLFDRLEDVQWKCSCKKKDTKTAKKELFRFLYCWLWVDIYVLGVIQGLVAKFHFNYAQIRLILEANWQWSSNKTSWQRQHIKLQMEIT